MAKKRTKAQKLRAASRRADTPLTPTGGSSNETPAVERSDTAFFQSKLSDQLAKSKSSKPASLLRVGVPMIKKDMIRSLLISIVVLSCLIGIYLYLRYN